ncbi:hypothetical protein MP228_003412 [Amoeboaphelidium protococcarum]|nr:hypothetical protein MP228_003412 [Amoeboaphelidium protococcarum]
MKYLAAYLLSSLTEEAPTKDKVKSILSSVGAEVADDRLNALFTALEGKDLAQLITEGNSKLASVASVSVSAGGASAGSSGAGASADKAEEKAAEKEEEESDDDMGFGLFD